MIEYPNRIFIVKSFVNRELRRHTCRRRSTSSYSERPRKRHGLFNEREYSRRGSALSFDSKKVFVQPPTILDIVFLAVLVTTVYAITEVATYTTLPPTSFATKLSCDENSYQ